MKRTERFLKVNLGMITWGDKTPMLHGVNLGGWLLMEAYFLHAPHRPQKDLKKQLRQKHGEAGVREFDRLFRDNFIQEDDIKNIKRLGFNCIRVPFHYNLIETKPYHYDHNGAAYLDRVIRWAKKYGIWVILDLHAACGSQNHDWHSDSYGKAELWTNRNYQKRTTALWEFLADRYKNEETVAGYDLLNEAVLADSSLLNRFYKELISAIRGVDKNHILFIEGSRWAQDLDCLDRFDDDNYALSIHNYEPSNFTFNFIPHLKYPFKYKGATWNATATRRIHQAHAVVAKRHRAPVFVGEFGVNYRQGLFNEHLYLKENLECFKQLGFHWTYWTYKAVKNSCFPDGLYSYYDNPAWVNRNGPVMGWNTFAGLWAEHKLEMAASWRTSEFTLNDRVAEVLQKYA